MCCGAVKRIRVFAGSVFVDQLATDRQKCVRSLHIGGTSPYTGLKITRFRSRQLGKKRTIGWAVAIPVVTLAGLGAAEPDLFSYSGYGNGGLIEMPTAETAPDAELTTTVLSFGNFTRTTLSFQITPRLSGSFRYSYIDGWISGPNNGLYDRSFDVAYRVLDEGTYRPAVTVGLRDFIGTGVLSSEYIVATKRVTPRLAITGGLGWGRLATRGGFDNPLGALSSRFDTRPGGFSGTGGQVETGRWFRGDAAFFGGLAWQATDKLQIKAEYSSDAYVEENSRGLITQSSPWNFGVDYKVNEQIRVQAFYLYGNTFGAALHLVNNPRKSTINGGGHAAPFPVRVRAPGAGRDLGWTTDTARQDKARTLLGAMLQNDGMAIEALDLTASTATLRLRNDRHGSSAEAIGRAARSMSQALPDSIEVFEIVPVSQGVPTAKITVKRRDLETLEHRADATELLWDRVSIEEPSTGRPASGFNKELYPKFEWGLGPYFRASYFDPDAPIRAEVGLQFNAEWNFAPGWYLTGSARKAFGGNIADSERPSNSVLPRVRSESNIYDAEGDPALTNLTLAYYFKPGENLYGRVTAGYLESHFGGISTEVLWKPVDSKLALGAEVNVVRQRDFDQLFGFRDYQVATGHLSGYYEFDNGFHAQVDAGRYLAGDWGATFALDREFANGWRVGAYATFTDVSFDDFGEGSFDKGLRFTFPLAALLGTATRKKFNSTIQPLTRDGGARLSVDGRLYEGVRDYHASGLDSSWGRVWR